MTRRRVRVAVGLFAALVVGGAVAAYVVLDDRRTPEIDCTTFRFDSAQFKRWQGDPDTGPYGPPHRPGSRFSSAQVAAHGLVVCGTLAGSSRRDVGARLGVPDGHAFGDRAWTYAVGPGQGLFGEIPSSEESLVVRFDARGRLIDAKLASRRK